MSDESLPPDEVSDVSLHDDVPVSPPVLHEVVEPHVESAQPLGAVGDGPLPCASLVKEEDEESLPPDPQLPVRVCCVRRCLDNPAVIQEQAAFRVMRSTLSRHNFLARVFHLILVAHVKADDSFVFCVGGVRVCRKASARVLCIGELKLKSLLSWARKGNVQPPADLRNTRKTSYARPRREALDRFFHWAYRRLAETFPVCVDSKATSWNLDFPSLAVPEVPSGDCEDVFLECDVDDGSATRVCTMPGALQKWLPRMSLTDLFTLYKGQATIDAFRKHYKRFWSDALPVRRESDHASCTVCDVFLILRKAAITPEARTQVEQAYQSHIDDMYRDRVVETRLCAFAIEAFKAPSDGGCVLPEESVFVLHVDSLDVGKTRVPHNITKAKAMAGLWRPHFHVTAALCEGALDVYFVYEQDVFKNANSQLTIIARGLENAVAVCKERSVPMPQQFVLRHDNASGELKNSTTMKFMMWACMKDLFLINEMSQLRVGHSHWKVDQHLRTFLCRWAKEKRWSVLTIS